MVKEKEEEEDEDEDEDLQTEDVSASDDSSALPVVVGKSASHLQQNASRKS